MCEFSFVSFFPMPSLICLPRVFIFFLRRKFLVKVLSSNGRIVTFVGLKGFLRSWAIPMRSCFFFFLFFSLTHEGKLSSLGLSPCKRIKKIYCLADCEDFVPGR